MSTWLKEVPTFVWIVVVCIALAGALVLLPSLYSAARAAECRHSFLGLTFGPDVSCTNPSDSGARAIKKIEQQIESLSGRLASLEEEGPPGPDVLPAEDAVSSGFGTDVLLDSRCSSLSRSELPELPLMEVLRPSDSSFEADFRDSACHLYALEVPSRSEYDIRTSPVGGTARSDTVISLFTPTGQQIGYDDDGGLGNYSALRETIPAGTFTVVVSSYGFQKIGTYSLTFQESDPTRTRALPVPTTVEGLVLGERPSEARLASGEELWYQFEIAITGEYAIETFAPRTGFGVDTLIQLYRLRDDALFFIGEDDDAKPGLYSLLSEVLDVGIYYLRVRSASSVSGDGEFRVMVEGTS